MSSFNINLDLLKKAWLLRWNQRIEETYAILSRIKSEGGLPSLSELKDQSVINRITTSKPLAEILLLEASLERAFGNFLNASSLVFKIKEGLEKNKLEAPFRLFFEMGLNYLCQGEFLKSLESFSRAEWLSKDPTEKLYTSVNILLCLEALGLNFSKRLSDLEAQIKRELKEEEKGALEQFQAFKIRTAFCEGDIDPLKKALATETTNLNQSRYQLFLYLNLAFVRSHLDQKSKFENGDTSHFYKKNFRIRTLITQFHPDDLLLDKPGHQVERIYAWTWKWLLNPQKNSIYGVLRHLDSLMNSQGIYALSKMDREMLWNSIEWLLLFSESSLKNRLELYLKRILPSTNRFPIFEIESLAIQYFKSLQSQDLKNRVLIKELLISHPLFNSKNLLFKEMIDQEKSEDPEGSLGEIFALNQKLISASSKKSMIGNYCIDLIQNKIVLPNQTETVSPLLSLLFSALKSEEFSSFEHLASICFGVRHYDSFIHDSKIHQTVGRLKKLISSDFKVFTKNSKVYIQGDLNSIKLIQPLEYQLDLKESFTSLAQSENLLNSDITSTPTQPLNSGKEIYTSKLLQNYRVGSVLTRKEIEEVYGKSRATANRIILTLLKEGAIKKTGKTRSTKYEVTTHVSQ